MTTNITINTNINTTNITAMSFWGIQTNPHYDSALANNGGGYFQPEGGAYLKVNDKDVIINLNDEDEGDFGYTLYWGVSVGNTLTFLWEEGNQSSPLYEDEEEEGEVNRNAISGILDISREELDALLRDVLKAVRWAAYQNI